MQTPPLRPLQSLRLAALAVLTATAVSVHASDTAVPDYRTIQGGSLRTVLPADGVAADAKLAPFQLRSRLVTNAEFAAFVRQHPEWQRATAPALFVAPAYLSGWRSPTDYSPMAADAPAIAELMLAAYRGTIDDEGETPQETLDVVRRLFAGEFGAVLWNISEVTERAGRLVAATMCTVWQGRPFVAFCRACR